MSTQNKKKSVGFSISKFKTKALKKEEAKKIKGGDGDDIPTNHDDENNIITDDIINY